MKDFIFSYPTKVYFGKGACKKALDTELKNVGQNIMLAYGGGSIKKNGIYDEIMTLLSLANKKVAPGTSGSFNILLEANKNSKGKQC